jgi:SAM-dependent methyltransferase
VDGILCQWAYMLMPDPAAALAESRRVLRPGGRLALAVLGEPAQNPWAASVAMSIVGLGLIPPIDPKAPGGLFSLAEPDGLPKLLVRAGFKDVLIEKMEFHLRFSDFEHYWSFIREVRRRRRHPPAVLLR